MGRFRKIEESQTLLINSQSKALESQDQSIIKFGFGQSPFLPPPKVRQALMNATHRKEYSEVQGLIGLREAISHFHIELDGIESDPTRILVGPGSKVLIYTILSAFEEADVFIPAPSWVSYAPQAKLARLHGIPVKTNFKSRWRVTKEGLNEAWKHKKFKESILILNAPGNPDGLDYSEKELKGIAKFCRKNKILVISDEIYGPLHFTGQHLSMHRFYPERTIVTTGLSKWCGAGGWRIGAALLYEGIHHKLFKAMIGIASETYSCAPTPMQVAAISAYENTASILGYIKRQRRILNSIAGFVHENLTNTGLRVHRSEGGFYMMPDFTNFKSVLKKKGILTSHDLCHKILLETGVALLPGTAFGLNPKKLAVRLAFVDFTDHPRNEKFDVGRHCPRIVEGVNRIQNWLSK